MGRPSGFTQAIADKICERIAAGESLRAICRDQNMPGLTSVWKWLGKHEDFGKQYARAREEQAETLADEIVAIADNGDLTSDDRRIRVDARKWVASKLKPKQYGDRVDVNAQVTVGWVGALMELGRQEPIPRDG